MKKKNINTEKQTKISYLSQKDKNEISNSITKNWTDQAIRCYMSCFNCTGCSISQGNYSFVCQMPQVVKILLEQIGPPEQNKVDKITA
jgi:hypothetical protein